MLAVFSIGILYHTIEIFITASLRSARRILKNRYFVLLEMPQEYPISYFRKIPRTCIFLTNNFICPYLHHMGILLYIKFFGNLFKIDKYLKVFLES